MGWKETKENVKEESPSRYSLKPQIKQKLIQGNRVWHQNIRVNKKSHQNELKCR